MRYIADSREMRQYDRNTSEHFGVPSIVLMERAALAFVEEVCARGVDLSRTLIVCGAGNNGGDGFAIARLLLLKGCKVYAVFAGEKNRASEQNLLQQQIFEAYGGVIGRRIPEEIKYTAVVDAVFGVGLSRALEGSYAELIAQMNELPGKKIAVDISSGILTDDGRIAGAAFKADLTVTFGFAKPGMLLWPGSEFSGGIAVKDIGIDERSWLGQTPHTAMFTAEDLALLPARRSHSNKGTFGNVLAVAGSRNMAGAAVLCARAAFAVGCGLVRVFTPEENRVVMQTAVPEAVLCTYRPGEPCRGGIAEALSWADAVVIGPGIGMSEASAELLEQILTEAAVPVLLDADALNLAAREPERFFPLLAGCAERSGQAVIVTPHLGEMSRLTGMLVSEIQGSLIQTAEDFAARHGVVCVLKDARTVTGMPGGGSFLNLSGNCGMATAGSGDVLSGVITSLLAQGLGVATAAPLGVYLHGLAGDLMRQETGTAGMQASDLVTGLRRFSALHEKDGGKASSPASDPAHLCASSGKDSSLSLIGTISSERGSVGYERI